MNFRNIPPVVKNLLIINGLLYLATILLQSQGIDLTELLGLHYWKSTGFYPHQLVTYMFMHSSSDFTHVLFNMFAVWMFGRVLEGVWGSKRFLIFYMVTGVGAGVIQLIVAHLRLMPLISQLPPEDMNMILHEGYDLIQSGKNWVGVAGTINGLINGVTVGASGAVFGILLAFGMLFPNTELMLLFPPIPIKAKWFVLGYGALELYSGFANNPTDNVAHFAHLGGMLFGFFLIQYWKKDRGSFY
ncbi:MAG: rhomboid family intramembrane serine protease [Flavobacteriales bacterium CG_4_10_14_0_2_um_filter_32_8]|nr:MAG: rhomboid family intramembrane serine protease [Flavobacteriales bacterium CG_4_10_14_0_2_um_filter_32_8]